MTALSALIHISCAVSPFESAYDAHDLHFQQIIADGEAILSARTDETDGFTGRRNPQHFSVGPGIIEPLFQTAYKYRDPVHRRRAIHLLSIAGREGPWNGPREASITSRIMLLEEHDSGEALQACNSNLKIIPGCNESYRSNAASEAANVRFNSKFSATASADGMQDHGSLYMSTVPQEKALCGESKAWMAGLTEAARINEFGTSSMPGNGRSSKKIVVNFSRCQNIQDVLSHQCLHGSGETSHAEDACAKYPHWERWTEILEF